MKCKLGDMAFIKKALRKENIGLIVTCKKYIGYYLKGDLIEIDKELWEAPYSDNYWIIESSSGSINTLFGKATTAYGPDTWLHPIKPDTLDTDENSGVTKEINDEVYA